MFDNNFAPNPFLPYPNDSNDGGIGIFLNGKKLTFDVEPRIVNNRIVVPLRAIFEAFGATVEFNYAERTVTSKLEDKVVVLIIGDDSPSVNGQTVLIDQPAIIINNRTLAPLRFVAEAFGGTVEWNSATHVAEIHTNNNKP